MRTTILPALLLLGLAACPPAGAQPADRPGVVDKNPEWLFATADGTLALGRDRTSPLILYAVDARDRRPLLTLALPDPVVAASFAADGDHLVVSTKKAVYTGSISSGRVDEAIPDATGAVAWDVHRGRIALLGRILTDPPPPTFSPDRTATLAIYDLDLKAWRARMKTPIGGDGLVAYDGDSLVAHGAGGRLGAHLASFFLCDVRVELATGRARWHRGETRLLGGSIKDPDYVVPEPARTLKAALERIRATRPRLPAPMLFAGPFLASHPFAGVDRGDLATYSIRGVVGSPPRLLAATLTIRRDGSIAMGEPVAVSDSAWAQDGRLVGLRAEGGDSTTVVDLADGRALWTIPESTAGPWAYELTRAAGGFLTPTCRFSRGDLPSPVVLKGPDGRPAEGLRPVSVPGAGEAPVLFASDPSRRDAPIRVFRPDDGAFLFEIPPYVERCVAVDPSATRLAYARDGRLVVLEIPSGRTLSDDPLDDAASRPDVRSWDGRWFVSGTYGPTRPFDPEKGWGPNFTIGPVVRAQPLGPPTGSFVLLEGAGGDVALADPASGVVQKRWSAGDLGLTDDAPRPALAIPAFGDRLLIRLAARDQSVDLIELAGRTALATVIPVASGDAFGWIAVTPDGLWDASPGAEGSIEAVQAAAFIPPRKFARRDPAAIRRRIAEAVGPARSAPAPK